MKTKLLFFLLSALFIIPINATSNKKGHRKVRSKILFYESEALHRCPLYFNLDVDDVDNTLFITFQSSLEEAEITVTDNTGNIVISEPISNIYEGQSISISNSNSYPYIIEISSPELGLGAEVTLEEI